MADSLTAEDVDRLNNEIQACRSLLDQISLDVNEASNHTVSFPRAVIDAQRLIKNEGKTLADDLLNQYAQQQQS